MRIVIQRVKEAEVEVEGGITGKIGIGLLIFVGVGKEDEYKDADLLVGKLVQLRIFNDSEGKMNLNVQQAGGALLIVSQFTLYGSIRKGRRPSFDDAAPPEKAQVLYDYFVQAAKLQGIQVETGVFRASMKVKLINDGPVTILSDSKSL
jgi:D-aminoacyl-tRNA deacylase